MALPYNNNNNNNSNSNNSYWGDNSDKFNLNNWFGDKNDQWSINTNAPVSPQQAQQGYINAYGNLSGAQQKAFMESPIDKRMEFQTNANKQFLDTGGSNWMNNGTLSSVGSALQGAGALAGAWAGLKQVKLAREMMGNQVDQWNKNYESQAVTINNRLNDQNAWKKAQGRTDMASLVPKYGNIG